MDQRVKLEKLIGSRIELLVMVKDIRKGIMKKDLLAACFEQVKVN
jgi:hypothetical protein